VRNRALTLRSVYDEFIRDVIIEDKVLVKIDKKRSSFSYSPAVLRTITVTSTELVWFSGT
jgi:hypothetical protein